MNTVTKEMCWFDIPLWKFPQQGFCLAQPRIKTSLPRAIQLFHQKEHFSVRLRCSLSPEVCSFLEFIGLHIGKGKYDLQSPRYLGWNLIFNIVNQSKWHEYFIRIPFKKEDVCF